MRQYVRAWINEWDLVRLDPAFRPESEAVEIASDYREDADLEIHLTESEDSARRDGRDRERVMAQGVRPRMRPRTLAEVIGQGHLTRDGRRETRT